MLARPKAQTPSERLEFGLRNFGYWFQSASEFWRGAGYYAARGVGPHAAFSLHQATERCFHAVLLVFSGYKPKTHDIEALAKQTSALHPELEGALPRTEPEDERLFSLLKRVWTTHGSRGLELHERHRHAVLPALVQTTIPIN